MKKVAVYVDQGVDADGLRQLIKNLNIELNPHETQVERIDANSLLSKSWDESTDLLIVPGGRDVFYHRLLEGNGTNKIRRFVERGGRYLGICAGAYFASRSIEFEKGGPLEVCGERSLKFFPGVARGPAYGPNKYSYESTSGVEAAQVSWNGEVCPIYFNGGCSFYLEKESPEVKTISCYSDLAAQPPAIVDITIGRGRAILSGVHIEYSIRYLNPSNPYLKPLLPLFEKGELQRREIFRAILSQLGILTKKNNDNSSPFF